MPPTAPSSSPVPPERNASPRSVGGNELGSGSRATAGSAGAAPRRPATPDWEYRWVPGTDPRTPAELEAFFRSPPIEELKRRMCDIGRRLWQREYADGNGGNLTIRVGDRLVLCTATLISKGFMEPDDICLVDFDGRQWGGEREPTSEALTHFGIMQGQPAAKACVHAHPPHATAFTLGRVEVPQYLIPEVEVFLGKIGVAEYATPGSRAYADLIGEAARDHQAVLMRNHGVIVWGKDIEDAYWKMENLDAYCRMLWIAGGLGGGLHSFSGRQAKELIERRLRQGMTDPRATWSEADLVNRTEPLEVRRPTDSANGTGASAPLTEAQIERIVRAVTEQVRRELGR